MDRKTGRSYGVKLTWGRTPCGAYGKSQGESAQSHLGFWERPGHSETELYTIHKATSGMLFGPRRDRTPAHRTAHDHVVRAVRHNLGSADIPTYEVGQPNHNPSQDQSGKGQRGQERCTVWWHRATGHPSSCSYSCLSARTSDGEDGTSRWRKMMDLLGSQMNMSIRSPDRDPTKPCLGPTVPQEGVQPRAQGPGNPSILSYSALS